MKTNKLFTAITFIVALAMAACSDYVDTVEQSPEVPAGNHGVYFPATNVKAFEMEPTEATEISLTIARTNSSGTASVPVTVEVNTDDVFNVPATVDFADGETEKEFTVTFPTAGEGKAYSLKLTVFGDEYVNPYSSALPYMTTSVTRIKWSQLEDPMIYADGAFAGGYGVSSFPMYVEAEKAEVTGKVRYRFKNAYDVATGVDADGVYDGYPYNDAGQFDEGNDYYTIIEIDNATKEVFMYAHEIGVDWGYGMISIGSIYGNVSTNKATYPLGKLVGEVITFPANSLYIAEAGYNDGAPYPSALPTVIYLTKDAFIAANMKIDDFNDVEYEAITGSVTEFESASLNDSWNQSFAKAIDIDVENEESEYKDLYFFSDLYEEGYGLAFYYKEGGLLKIPASQNTGLEVFGKEVFVSQSDEYESSVEVNAKGVTVYTLGMMFHYEDGTIVGDFAERFYYSEDPVVYEKADFIGAFNMTGPSQFSGEPSADFDVTIAEGESADQLVITGIDYAEEVIANFDASTSTLSIAPQTLADFVTSSATFDMTLYTTTLAGDVSTTASIDLTFNMQGNLVIKPSSEADGYLIRSEVAGGYVDGYYGIEFSPATTRSAAVQSQVVPSFSVQSANFVKRETVESVDLSNFKISGNIYDRHLKNTSILPIN